MDLKKEKILEYFKDLEFVEKTHLYFVKGKKLKLSVSGIIKKFIKEVDFGTKAIAKDEKFNLPSGTTQKIWDLKKEYACAKGSRAHFFGEVYPFHRHLTPSTPYEEAIVKFWNDLPEHIIPVFTELEMYHKEYMFGGMKDITLYNTKTKTYIIADYKTNEELFNNFMGKKMLPPFQNLLDDNFNHYQIQFSLYQILFEQTGYKVSARKLIWLLPDGTYKMYDTKDLTPILKDWLSKNKVC